MFLAAFTSALSVRPQARHRKTAWLSRFSFAVCPHSEQRLDVFAGLTATTAQGEVAAVAFSVRRFLKSAQN